ncbi:MAG: GNAT family N-acetyltransferase [Abitibacteriaceae bacterium]|nr:GNAT family N-acetyltransferase [Abditibacteriaceae bacterium]
MSNHFGMRPIDVRPVDVRPIAASATLPLRSAVLRPGRPVDTAIFPEDDAPDTLHLGVFDQEELVGVVSLYPKGAPMIQQPSGKHSTAWQLRGMAIHPARQRQGYGTALVLACRQQVAARGGTLIWCNARTSAVAFYQAMGFVVQGDEFVIPDVGPHFLMVWHLHTHER